MRMMQQQMEALQKLVAESSKREEKKSEMEQLKLTKLTEQDDIEAFLTNFERIYRGVRNREKEMGIQVGTPAYGKGSEGVCGDGGRGS